MVYEFLGSSWPKLTLGAVALSAASGYADLCMLSQHFIGFFLSVISSKTKIIPCPSVGSSACAEIWLRRLFRLFTEGVSA